MKVVYWLEKNFERSLMAISLSLICLFMFIDIFGRQVVGHSPTWAQELARFNMLNVCFLGISYGIRYNAHIRVETMAEVFPKFRPFLDIAADVIMLIFSVTLFHAGFGKLASLARMGQITAGTGMPMTYVYGLLQVGFGCTIFRIIQKYVLKIVFKKEFSYDAQDRRRIIDLVDDEIEEKIEQERLLREQKGETEGS